MKVDVDELVTGAEVGRRVGLSRERIRQLAERDDFPKPVGRAGVAILWRWPDVQRWSVERAEQLDRGQPLLEATSEGLVFRTVPGQPGLVDIYRSDGTREGAAVAWIGSPILDLEGVPGGVKVRSRKSSGEIHRNARGSWTLRPAQSSPD